MAKVQNNESDKRKAVLYSNQSCIFPFYSGGKTKVEVWRGCANTREISSSG